MNFDTLLQYAQLDTRMANIEKQFNAQQVVIDYNNATKLFNDERDQFNKLGKKFLENNKELENLIKELEQIQFEITDSENLENSYTSSDEMAYPLSQLNAMEKKLSELDARTSKLRSIIKGLDEEIKAVASQAQAHNNTIRKLSGQYTKYQEHKEDLEKECIEKKQKLEASIDKELLDAYKTQVASGKTKVIFEHTPGVAMCPACFKHMGNEIDKLQGSGDYIFCPECGAILIIK